MYHMTGARSALSILTSGNFLLSMADGLDRETAIGKGYAYFMSTMRTRNNAFALRNRDSEVLFTLNDRAIKSRYKTEAADYWDSGSNPRLFESEERILSNKPTIPVKGNVTSVSVCVADDTKSSMLRKVVLACVRQKIRVVVYKDKPDFLAQKESAALPLNAQQLMALTKIPANVKDTSLKGQLEAETLKRQSLDVSSWLAVLNAAAHGRLGQLTRLKSFEISKLLKDIRSGGSFSDRALISDLETRMMYGQMSTQPTRQRSFAQAFSRMLRELGLTMKTVIPYIREKVLESLPESAKEIQ